MIEDTRETEIERLSEIIVDVLSSGSVKINQPVAPPGFVPKINACGVFFNSPKLRLYNDASEMLADILQKIGFLSQLAMS
jgi:hypothetical protein